jgi:hypothetical protein
LIMAPEPRKNPTRSNPTHRDLVPPGMCPSLMMKQIAIHAMDDEVYDDREYPGDGYYWCLNTCCEIGPDDQIAEPGTCGPHRRCWDGPKT